MGEDQWELVLGDETTSCGSWLVSCTTLVKLSRCQSGRLQCPKITSTSTKDGSCALTVDQVFVHLSKDQELLHMQTKHKVDDLSILEGGYVVMGMSDGALTVGVLEKGADDGNTKFVIKSSQKVVQCDSNLECAFKRVMLRLTGDRVAQVVALTSVGSLIVVSNIELQDGDINVQGASMETLSVSRDAKDFVICGDCYVLLGQGDASISVYSTQDLTLIDLACQYEDTMMTHIWACGSDMFFTLDTQGILYLWNLSVLVVVDSFPLTNATDGHPVSDLRLAYSQEPNTADFSLASLSAAVLSEESIRMLQFPSMSCSFEQKVDTNNTIFLSKSPLAQDDIFVAQCNTEYDEDDNETCLSIKFLCYAETDPERRLDKLLARKQFEDAQHLIKTYNIQFNITPYLVQDHMYNALPSLDETEQLLKSCRKQIDDCKDKDDLVAGVSAELHGLNYRLDVFVKVFGQKAYSPSEWQRFQHTDILDEVITLFTSQDFEKAFDLWHYFQLDMITRLKPGMVGKILQSLTTATTASRITSPALCNKVLDWLVVDIVPYLVWAELLADEMVSIVQWILSLVGVMEHQQRDWPSNGIDVCERMVKCLQNNMLKPWDQEAGLWSEKITSSQHEDLIQTLRDTVGFMNTIDVLKTRFQCHLSLDVVRKESKESLVYRMLDKVKVVESLPMVLKTQILPYVAYNNIKADKIFASYVKDIMQRVSHNPYDMSSWQTKVQAIIDVIQAPKEKVLSVMNLVQHSRLPFADFVEGLVTSILDSVKHPLTATLRTEWQTLQASNLLCLYGYEPFSVTPSKALSVAQYFILQDRPSSMSDAKKFLQAVGVEGGTALAKYQAMFYIENDRLCDLMVYLKSLSADVARTCARWCMGMAECNMASMGHPLHAVEKASKIRFFSAGILSADILKNDTNMKDPLELEDIERMKTKLRSALILEDKYDIGLDRFDLDDQEKCLEVFKRQVEGKGHKEHVLIRIAELLGVCREMALCCMLEHAALEGSVETVSRLSERLCQRPSVSIRGFMHNTAVRLAGLEQPGLVTPARHLATHALVYCAADITSRHELTRQITLLERAYAQCQDEGKGVNSLLEDLNKEGGDASEHDDWADLFGPSYSQVKMPLTHSHLQDAYSILTPLSKGPISEKRSTLTELTSQLVSYGHDELGLDVLTHVQHQAHKEQDDNEAIKSLINKAITKVSARLLGKVMKQTPSDKQVCLPLALQLPHSHIISLLNQETKSTTVHVNHNRLKKILEVATAYGELHGSVDLVDHCVGLSRQEKWRNRLAKLGISLGPTPSKKTVLQAVTTLMLDNNTTFPLVQEFVLDMDLNEEVVQQEYQASFGSILTQAPVSPGALDKARSILESISDASSRLAAIEHALPMTSEYNYEVLQFLMEQMEVLESTRTNKKSMELLKLLKEYTRKYPPCGIEEEAISTSCNQLPDIFSSLSTSGAMTTTSSTAATMAKMAAWERQQQLVRLPFRLLQAKMGKIMEAELTPATLPTWQLIASVLGSQKDRILISLATKLVTSYIKPHINGGGGAGDSGGHINNNGMDTLLNGSVVDAGLHAEDNGEVTEEFENLLQQIGPILIQMERKECGIWLCQATADRLSRIGDKVRTLESGLSYATMWAERCSTAGDDDCEEDRKKAEKAIKVFETKIPVLSTQWALIRAGLGSREELIPLISQPEQLIRHLYHLPLTTATAGDGNSKRGSHFINDGEEDDKRTFDEAVIHNICEEIANLHDIDLLSIQTSLIDLWLTGSDTSSAANDAEQTMFNVTTDFNLGCEAVNEEESVPRIVSMLKSFNGSEHAEHLLEILFGDECDGDVTLLQLQETLSLNSRRTAILCLSETGHASPELKLELKLLNQLIALQSFGISFTPDMYAQVEKLPVLLRLWDKYKGQCKVTPLLGSLCLDQSHLDIPPQLWSSILTQMAKADQRTSLRPLMMSLMQTRGLEKVRRTDGFIQAKKVV